MRDLPAPRVTPKQNEGNAADDIDFLYIIYHLVKQDRDVTIPIRSHEILREETGDRRVVEVQYNFLIVDILMHRIGEVVD